MLSFSLRHAVPVTFLLCALFVAQPASSSETAALDEKSAVVFAYFSVGDDSNPNASIRAEQFIEQADELASGGYKVLPLPQIIAAFESGKPLPPRAVAITFDGADRSILEKAVPYLVEHELPFTIFIPAGRIGKAPYMDWNDLQTLKKTGLANFGAHPADYSRMASAGQEEIRRQINNSTASIRENLNIEPLLIAYPFGEYSATFEATVKAMGFKAAFGQNSGVASAADDRFALPRFTQTERYGDLERFRMTANALPLPVRDVSPADPYLGTLSPAIGFTVADEIAQDLKNLSCFSSTREKPVIEIVGKRRVEIRMDGDFSEDRPRINCTLPVTVAGEDEPRWRWFGTLYTIKSDLLEAELRKGAPKEQRHAADSVDDISVE